MKKFLFTVFLLLAFIMPLSADTIEVYKTPEQVWIDNMINNAVGPYLVYMDTATETAFRDIVYISIPKIFRFEPTEEFENRIRIIIAIKEIKNIHEGFIVMQGLSEYENLNK